jgi:CDP-paratose 2-epimerase
MKVLITGGAGFIGCNLARALTGLGHKVTVVDNLSRVGSGQNLRLVLEDGNGAELVSFRQADVRDKNALAAILTESGRPYDAVVHLAGQTTVTESVTNPVEDFDVNASGTLAVLEAIRTYAPAAHVIFASTNKVYGDLHALCVEKTHTRYILPDHPEGIPETFPTNAVSPYGCSKLAADNYVRDYAATYGMATTVFRLSCIYGRWQNGMPGQGWVSWFVRCALTGAELTIYGDGLQTRDLLHIQDLVDAFIPMITERQGVGETFNAGGGPAFSLSVWAEFGPMLEELAGRPVNVRFAERRIGDQDVYISNHQKLSSSLGWKPRLSPRDGTGDLVEWMTDQLGNQR